MKKFSECAILPPRQSQMIGERDDGYFAACIRPQAHFGPHVFRTPEGQLIAWEDDWECDCCEPEEDDRCNVYWDIEEAELANLSTKRQT